MAKRKREKSGTESNSLPGQQYQKLNDDLKMKLRIESEKMESESGLFAECPARRQRHTNEKLVPLNKGLDELRKRENEIEKAQSFYYYCTCLTIPTHCGGLFTVQN